MTNTLITWGLGGVGGGVNMFVVSLPLSVVVAPWEERYGLSQKNSSKRN